MFRVIPVLVYLNANVFIIYKYKYGKKTQYGSCAHELVSGKHPKEKKVITNER